MGTHRLPPQRYAVPVPAQNSPGARAVRPLPSSAGLKACSTTTVNHAGLADPTDALGVFYFCCSDSRYLTMLLIRTCALSL